MVVAVCGRFHGFQLAIALQQHGVLHTLFTSYPVWGAAHFGVDRQRVRSLWPVELTRRLGFLSAFGLQQFDAWVARNLTGGEVLVGWAGGCLTSLQQAHRLGMKTVVERSSSHIQHQMAILTEEYARWGLRFQPNSPQAIDRELQEYEQATAIAVPSEFVRQTFLARGYPAHKLLYLPLGVSLQQFYPEPQREPVPFRVLFCGNLSLQKGIPYLLQAFLALNLPQAELWLVGQVLPEIRPFLAKYSGPGLRVWGKRPQSQLRALYNQCAVFCLPSVQDGFGVVIPQAMACGLPVIHTPHTGGPDLVRDGMDGFCVPIRDVEALQEKILYLYENPDACQAMGQNALRQAQTALSWEQYGERAIAAYHRLRE
ncbi:MAG: glycosyltransferase family 4 protein [Pseudanabaenaceae cyanobacterium]